MKLSRRGRTGWRVLVMSGLLAAGTWAQQPEAGVKPDDRVTSILKKIGYKYITTPLGNFRLDFELVDKRSHWVYVSSRTEMFEGYETRKVWAFVYKSKGLLTADLANKLLMDNVPQKAGAFELSKASGGDGYEVVYAAHINADAGPKEFRSVVRLVFLNADAKEKELTNKDEF